MSANMLYYTLSYFERLVAAPVAAEARDLSPTPETQYCY